MKPNWMTKWEEILKDFNVWRTNAISYWKTFVTDEENIG